MKPALTKQEIAAFRQPNIEQMKRDADNLEKAKWTVIIVVMALAFSTAYSVRFL